MDRECVWLVDRGRDMGVEERGTRRAWARVSMEHVRAGKRR